MPFAAGVGPPLGKCANWVPQSRSFVGTINAVDLGGGIVTTQGVIQSSTRPLRYLASRCITAVMRCRAGGEACLLVSMLAMPIMHTRT